MDDRRDVLISRQVAIKAAVEMAVAHPGNIGTNNFGTFVTALAEDFAGWILSAKQEVPADPGLETAPRRLPTSTNDDPGPPAEWPEDERKESGFHGAPPASPRCSGPDCNGETEFFSGMDKNGDEYRGYRCVLQAKTRDKAEQAAERVRHPVQWIND